MRAMKRGAGWLAVAGLVAAGCGGGAVPLGDNPVAEVAAKAGEVADQIGGETGFGGSMMAGYRQHAPPNMGFMNGSDLASEGGRMSVRMHNQSGQDGTFHVTYVSSASGLEEQSQDVSVPAGDETVVDLPCAEMVGMGPLQAPGQPGCTLADGEEVPNTMAVPGFLGLDFGCEGAEYHCFLTPDVDDLDQDGDTEELILLTEAMQEHMQNGGPTGHMHGSGPGMMGPHMGG